MSRISKEPEERKEEIILAAKKLFEEKGYEDTMMSDVAQSIGISQGLPYRYFRSKLELLDAVAVKFGEEFLKLIIGYSFKPGANAKEKLDIYLKLLEKMGTTRLTEALHKKDNKDIHSRIFKNAFLSLRPNLIALIAEGNRDGSFDCQYPEESADFLLSGIFNIHEMYAEKPVPEFVEIMRILFYRVLGVKSK